MPVGIISYRCYYAWRRYSVTDCVGERNPEVLVKLNGEPRKATIVFADRRDLGLIEGWREKLGADNDTKRRDALEMAQLAIDSFIAHSSVQQLYVNSAQEIVAHIKDDEKNEIAGFVLLKGRFISCF